MIWEATPTGKRGCQLDYSDAAIPELPYDEGAVRHCAEADDRVCRKPPGVDRPGLGGAVPNFTTVSFCQKTLYVNIPYR